MSILKKIPITYKGELTNIRLINFSVDMEEVKTNVPPQIKVREINGRALISMVDVSLKKMRPAIFPEWLSFNYRHIAFRLLVDDSTYNSGDCKGIFFLRSFTNKPLVVFGGSLLTSYNLGMAEIKEANNKTELIQGNKKIIYQLNDSPVAVDAELKQVIGNLDRAYMMLGDEKRATKIVREKWPIEFINCDHFETNFFPSAKFEGAFHVKETIYYTWLPPQKIIA